MRRHPMSQPMASTAAKASRRRKAVSCTWRKEMPQEIRPVVDINQNISQIDLRQTGFDQFLKDLHRILFLGRFQGSKAELALRWINRKSFIMRNTPVDLRSHSVEPFLQLHEVFICFGRQFEMGVMPGFVTPPRANEGSDIVRSRSISSNVPR